ncbi:hypothetical protein PG985_003544 [Apiospora marii]|uniref:Uncharacterized protein n=1 Tax=Apiospora marii TaxID=335849 RepID=A0ABR1SHU0_9PEZI
MEYRDVPRQDSTPSITGRVTLPPASRQNAAPTSTNPTAAPSAAGSDDYPKPAHGLAKGRRSATLSLPSVFSFNCFKGKCKSDPKAESKGLLTGEQKESKRRYNWTSEVLLGLIAILSSLAIILLMVFADGHPLDSFKIPLPLVIAGLGATTRGSLAFAIGACLAQGKWNWLRQRSDNLMSFKKFDEASRGPMGALYLVFWLHLRHWATLGALVTVLLLAFDPLLQGAISHSGKLVDAPDLQAPTIPYSSRLDAGTYAPDGNSSTHGIIPDPNHNYSRISLEEFASTSDLRMAAAVYNGFTGVPSYADFHCESGNCTWPSFLSLGVCSSCNDVTDNMAKKTEEATSGTIPTGSTVMVTDNYTKYSLEYMDLSNADSVHKSQLSAYMAVGGTNSPNETVSYRENDRLIAALGIIKAADTYEKNQTIWAETEVTATECALYFCIKRFDAAVEKAELKENATEIKTSRVKNSYGPVRPKDRNKFKILQKMLGNSLFSKTGDLPRHDLQLTPSDVTQLDNTSLVVPAVFNISQNAVGSMISFISKELLGGYEGILIWPPFKARQGFFQSSAASTFFNSTDLSETMQKLAGGLTDWARDASSGTSKTPTRKRQQPQHQEEQQQDHQSVLGTPQTWIQHVRVRWEYMTLPLFTLVAGFLFVGLSIRETRRMKLAPWKADMIATLAYSLDAETRAQLRFAARQGHVGPTAREMYLDFAESGHGLELKARREQQQRQ